jgi:hypothetical protein
MTEPDPAPWQPWAPPLDPPNNGGLPVAVAEQIAATWWDEDWYYALGLMWEAYAAMLTPTPAVSTVSTGAQSVSYNPAAPTGDYGEAIARADWFFARSHNAGGLVSIPLTTGAPVDAIGLGWVDP